MLWYHSSIWLKLFNIYVLSTLDMNASYSKASNFTILFWQNLFWILTPHHECSMFYYFDQIEHFLIDGDSSVGSGTPQDLKIECASADVLETSGVSHGVSHNASPDLHYWWVIQTFWKRLGIYISSNTKRGSLHHHGRHENTHPGWPETMHPAKVLERSSWFNSWLCLA